MPVKAYGTAVVDGQRALRRMVAAGAVFALAGCAASDGVSLGLPLSATGLAAPADSGESIASEKIEALLGAGFGGGLGPGDLAAAYKAQTRALDQSRAGTSVTWTNPGTGNRGEIVPGPVYVVNNLECRDFSHTVETTAGREVRRGAACRRTDGSWQAIA